jgi:hypothetical protein
MDDIDIDPALRAKLEASIAESERLGPSMILTDAAWTYRAVPNEPAIACRTIDTTGHRVTCWIAIVTSLGRDAVADAVTIADALTDVDALADARRISGERKVQVEALEQEALLASGRETHLRTVVAEFQHGDMTKRIQAQVEGELRSMMGALREVFSVDEVGDDLDDLPYHVKRIAQELKQLRGSAPHRET